MRPLLGIGINFSFRLGMCPPMNGNTKCREASAANERSEFMVSYESIFGISADDVVRPSVQPSPPPNLDTDLILVSDGSFDSG